MQSTFFFEAGSKLMVVAGYGDIDPFLALDSVEMIDLKNPMATCDPIQNFPMDTGGMQGTYVPFNRKVLVCGGRLIEQICFYFNNETRLWEEGPSMLDERDRSAGLWLDDSTWWITGGVNSHTTEILTWEDEGEGGNSSH